MNVLFYVGIIFLIMMFSIFLIGQYRNSKYNREFKKSTYSRIDERNIFSEKSKLLEMYGKHTVDNILDIAQGVFVGKEKEYSKEDITNKDVILYLENYKKRIKTFSKNGNSYKDLNNLNAVINVLKKGNISVDNQDYR